MLSKKKTWHKKQTFYFYLNTPLVKIVLFSIVSVCGWHLFYMYLEGTSQFLKEMSCPQVYRQSIVNNIDSILTLESNFRTDSWHDMIPEKTPQYMAQELSNLKSICLVSDKSKETPKKMKSTKPKVKVEIKMMILPFGKILKKHFDLSWSFPFHKMCIAYKISILPFRANRCLWRI